MRSLLFSLPYQLSQSSQKLLLVYLLSNHVLNFLHKALLPESIQYKYRTSKKLVLKVRFLALSSKLKFINQVRRKYILGIF